jgi:hypothetical protein
MADNIRIAIIGAGESIELLEAPTPPLPQLCLDLLVNCIPCNELYVEPRREQPYCLPNPQLYQYTNMIQAWEV